MINFIDYLYWKTIPPRSESLQTYLNHFASRYKKGFSVQMNEFLRG